MGMYPKSLMAKISGNPRIWIQAVSVGEVNVAAAIIRALKKRLPGCAVIVSTTTVQGQQIARQKLGNDTTCIYAPLDLPQAVRSALKSVCPDMMVFLETELWHNWLSECRRLNIGTVLINGRISVRSVKKYLKIRSFMQETLNLMDRFSMIGKDDAERIRMLGALPDRIAINGNAKYETYPCLSQDEIYFKIKQLYNIRHQPVLVAGSTRSGEEEKILSAYRKILQVFPETLLIIAPRHTQRAESVRKLVIREKFACQFRSELNSSNVRTAQVVILNTIGELQATYGIASAVFCGGSLVPLGGQNIMEPAVWAKPIFYGPSTEDFQDARILLESLGGGVMVYDSDDLAQNVVRCISEPHHAALMGMRAKEALQHHQGAADRHAEAIITAFAARPKFSSSEVL
jgi:3-deoxy-D-manno-octulosonic-acid transferase